MSSRSLYSTQVEQSLWVWYEWLAVTELSLLHSKKPISCEAPRRFTGPIEPQYGARALNRLYVNMTDEMRRWSGPFSRLAGGLDNNRTEPERGAEEYNNKPSHPKQDVESEDEVFDAAADVVAFVLIPRHVWGEEHGLLYRLCVRGGTGSALRGGITTGSASNLLTAGFESASGACRGLLEACARGVAEGGERAVNPRIKKIRYFLGELRLEEAYRCCGSSSTIGWKKRSRDWRRNQSYSRKDGQLPVSCES